MPEWIEIDYAVTLDKNSNIERFARDIALEQTVEVPETCVTDSSLWERVIGRVLDIAPKEKEGNTSHYLVKIGYPPEVAGHQVPQFLNVFFGNISLKNNIRIVSFQVPESLAKIFKGPNLGSDGLRQWLGVYERPLAATALKPMGSSPQTLAAQARAFALGGGDIIKDDHGLADQAFCPFEERVGQCQEAVDKANAATGRRTLYFPNVVGDHEQVIRQVEFAIRQGVRGVLISPFLIGPALLRFLASRYPIAYMAHPAFTGTHFHDRRHGMAPAVLLGKIFRLLGADISVFPNSGGRFGFTQDECGELAQALRQPLPGVKPAFPAPAGGMGMDRIETMAEQYGCDVVYLIGGALLNHSGDLAESTRLFMQAIRSRFTERLASPAGTVMINGKEGLV
jgi:ribulose-bisphosphate carboxylase large chain